MLGSSSRVGSMSLLRAVRLTPTYRELTPTFRGSFSLFTAHPHIQGAYAQADLLGLRKYWLTPTYRELTFNLGCDSNIPGGSPPHTGSLRPPTADAVPIPVAHPHIQGAYVTIEETPRDNQWLTPTYRELTSPQRQGKPDNRGSPPHTGSLHFLTRR